MNINISEAGTRRHVLQLWWLKARRAAAGQNDAADRADRAELWATRVNIASSLFVFALSLYAAPAELLPVLVRPLFPHLLSALSLVVVTSGIFQYVAGNKEKAIKHRAASVEFESLARNVEASGFHGVADDVFNDLGYRMDLLARTSLRVPSHTWRRARNAFAEDIGEVRRRLREPPSDDDGVR